MELYGYQKEIARCVRAGKNIILQAPTGAGKTMAALWPFLQSWADPAGKLPRKCIYAVPMRVLANQFDAEYKKISREQMLLAAPPTIAKQTGEHPEDPQFRADITFATIDQLLSSWLMIPYSLPYRLGNLNAGAAVGSYLVFDEFHLFDPDSTLPTTLQMLEMLNGVSPFILMTATFSKEMLGKLAAHLNAVPFLLTEEMLAEIPAQQKERRFYTQPTPLTYKDEDKEIHVAETAVSHILQTHEAQDNEKPRTLVVCNQVERAQAVYRALRAQKSEHVTICLLHSRFLKQDREDIERFIRREFNKDTTQYTIPSLIVVATQVVEVGLDMSCGILHTELAPAAAVLQRAGRCARYAGQSGRVYVYPLAEKEYAPYQGKYARQQCDLTWEWLRANQDRHLTFTDEQALINHAHTNTDSLILKAVFETGFEWKSLIQSVWRGEKNKGEAAALVRQIQSVTLVVHSDLDQLREAPFKAESFSLHPGTLRGKFEQWRERNEAIDPDFEEGHLDWLVQKLVEDESDEEAQGNQPIRYGFRKVSSVHELYAPLLVVHPTLVGYSAELGLTLYPGPDYQSAIPPTAVAQQRQTYRYRLESYYRHIELVHRAFTEDSLDLLQAAAQRLERAYGWQPGILTDMAHLVVALHDAGKLSQGWQKWAHEWQARIGSPIGNPHYAAAHSDYDPDNPEHREQNRRMRTKRPAHAIESALAAMPFLQTLVAHDLERYKPLLRAAFTAISRHHAPFSSQADNYHLVAHHAQHIAATLNLLPPTLQAQCRDVQAHEVFDTRQLGPDFLEKSFFIDPKNGQDMCCYMLLVRALRMADQKGTELGSR